MGWWRLADDGQRAARLEAQGWNKQAPGPTLPPEIVTATSERYMRLAKPCCIWE